MSGRNGSRASEGGRAYEEVVRGMVVVVTPGVRKGFSILAIRAGDEIITGDGDSSGQLGERVRDRLLEEGRFRRDDL